ncbi:MAG: hypothetical protein E6Q68_04800 [Polynucleobacter sp.]|nr:MAG: hypothetical protein E6Q68_04800 [Polynucleobacter sp.]
MNFKYFKVASLLLALSAMLSACGKSESTATQASVETVATRVDQFQGVAANQKVAVLVGKGTVAVIPHDGSKPTRVQLKGIASLIDVATCADGSFVALDFYKKVWTSSDDGQSWSSKATPEAFRPLGLACGSNNSYWIVGSNSSIANSANRGASWSVNSTGEDAMFNTVQFIDGQTAFVTGEYGAFKKSTDGGKTWATSSIGPEFYPYAALFTSAREGFVTSLTGIIMHTKDGGASWSATKNPTGLSQFGLINVDGRIYSVGLGGTVLSFNGGQWSPVKIENFGAPYLKGVANVGKGSFLVAGGNGAWKVVSAKN